MIGLFKGIIVGLSVALPLGPTGCLCLDYGIRRGFMSSLFAGLGAALADTLFGFVAHLGVSAIQEWITRLQLGLAFVGGGVLIYLGIKKLTAPPLQTLQVAEGSARQAAFAGTFLFTLANPLTIFGMTALMATVGYSSQGTPWLSGSLLLTGVFVGALCWYAILAGISLVLRSTLSLRIVSILQRITGGMILGMGGLLLVKGIMMVAQA